MESGRCGRRLLRQAPRLPKSPRHWILRQDGARCEMAHLGALLLHPLLALSRYFILYSRFSAYSHGAFRVQYMLRHSRIPLLDRRLISCAASTEFSNLNLHRLVSFCLVIGAVSSEDITRKYDNAAISSQAVDGDLQVSPVSIIHNLSRAFSITV